MSDPDKQVNETDSQDSTTGVDAAKAELSRELRTQLADILGSAELLQRQLPDNNPNVEQILKAGRNLLALAERLAEPRSAPPVPPQPKSPGTSHVLYIEDNAANYKLVERILAQRPTVRVSGAILGGEGLEAARRDPPDLILLDLNLPDMHGSEVLEQLRAVPGTRSIPVIVISADATTAQIDKLLGAGARNYLTKPFRVDRFLRTVDDALASGPA